MICAILAFLCMTEMQATHTSPSFRVSFNRTFLSRPSLTTAKKDTAEYWDSDCKVVPPNQFKNVYRQSAMRYPSGLNACELAHQGKAESGFRTDVVSSAGAIGIAQFLPGTANDFGIDPRDPVQSIYAQARYMSWQISQWRADYPGRTNDDRKRLGAAGYNWGIGSLLRSQRQHAWTIWSEAEEHMPRETQDYVRRIFE